MEGTIKFFNEMKGFGFIAVDGGEEEVFVHQSALEEGTTLKEGDRVSFDKEPGDNGKGPKAVNVKKL